MKQLFIINTHSVIDVITNSSSELFVCKTDKTLETVKEMLKTKNLGEYEEPWIFNLKDFRAWKQKEAERSANWEKWTEEHQTADGNPFAWTDEQYDHPFHTIDGWFQDDENEQDILEARKRIIEDGPETTQWIGTFAYSGRAENPFRDRIHEAEDKAATITKLTVNDDKRWRVRVEARKAEIEKIYEELQNAEYKPSWWKNPIKFTYHDTPVRELDGCIMIMSSDDNSMNFDEFDWIEDTFNATRTHLG